MTLSTANTNTIDFEKAESGNLNNMTLSCVVPGNYISFTIEGSLSIVLFGNSLTSAMLLLYRISTS